MMMSEQDEIHHLKKLESVAEDYEMVDEEPMEEIPISLNAINEIVRVSNILIYSRSTVSFIQTSTAKKLGCKYFQPN